MNQTYDNNPKPVTATTNYPDLDLTVLITYTGTSGTTYGPSTDAPTNAGIYHIDASIDDTDFEGSTTGTLTVAKAAGTVTLGNTSQTYDGAPKSVTTSTTPLGLTVVVTYTGTSYGPTRTAPTAAGTYSVTAAIDDANYQGTATGTLGIAQAATSMSVASSPNPSAYNSAVTFTATVTPSAATGTVQFYADGAALGSAATISAGQATLANSSLATGSHVITGTYSGDSNYAGSTATLSSSQVVTKATATVSLSHTTQAYDSTPRPVVATTNPVSLTVVITYTGTGGTTYPASTTAPTSTGSYNVNAVVVDTNYAGSTTGTLTVDKGTPTITLASSANPSYFGASVIFTATVSPAPATGSVTFYADGAAMQSKTLASSKASMSTLLLPMGTHVITASYDGDVLFNAGTGTLSPDQVVGRAEASVSLGNLSQTYDGTPRAPTATTDPTGLTVVMTYTGTSGTTYGPTQTAPTNAGTYTVTAMIDDPDLQGSTSGTLTIAPAAATVSLSGVDADI